MIKKKDRSKFNVSKDTQKRTCDDIVFDSVLEMNYYKNVILPSVESGEIKSFELQKKYELQPKFESNEKNIKAIIYVADFYIEYANGDIKVIDIKGMPDSVAKIKRKMFLYKYPDIEYVWLSYSKIDGGWIEYENLKKAREIRRQKRKYGSNYKENYYTQLENNSVD